MAEPIPQTFVDLFSKRAFAHLATVMADGSPQVTPVWCDFDGRHILINTAKDRVKDRNMRRNPNVAMDIIDPDNPYRYLAVQGTVVDITEEGADQHIDKMAKKYMGRDTYPYRTATEVRVIFKVEPGKVHTFGS